jgi:hypothetical protein
MKVTVWTPRVNCFQSGKQEDEQSSVRSNDSTAADKTIPLLPDPTLPIGNVRHLLDFGFKE